jgi:hypothetical protein
MQFVKFCEERYNHQAGDYGMGSISFGNIPNSSDISAHLPLIELLAKLCNSVAEFGTRTCYSTCALLRGCKNVTSYDILTNDTIKLLKELVPEWNFQIQDTGDENFVMPPVDLLMIDSLHTYDHVKNELKQAKYVNKFLIFHDTISQGIKSLDKPDEVGILPAIEEFMQENPEWVPIYEVTFNHGLLVLGKIK